MDIQRDTSPELAIKVAYDFARNLRTQEGTDIRFPEILALYVTQPFADHASLPYVIAGFTCGFYYQSLPWRREIEAKLVISKPA